MRIYQLKACARMARKARISDAALIEAVDRAGRGLVDADFGHRLFKQRVARPGQGKSGGFRFLLALEKDERAVFLFGFAKNAKDNIDDDELASARGLGAAWLALPEKRIEQALADGQLIEVEQDDSPEEEADVPPSA